QVTGHRVGTRACVEGSRVCYLCVPTGVENGREVRGVLRWDAFLRQRERDRLGQAARVDEGRELLGESGVVGKSLPVLPLLDARVCLLGQLLAAGVDGHLPPPSVFVKTHRT